MYKQKNYSQLLSEIESNSKIKSLIIKTEVSANDLCLYVDNQNIYDLLKLLRDSEDFLFSQLTDLCGVDWPENEIRFQVVYNLLSMSNNSRIRVSKKKKINDSILATGGPSFESKKKDKILKEFNQVSAELKIPVRKFGSAALDLANVACGRFDGFWQWELNYWDIAAGVLLIKESGGFIDINYDKNLSNKCNIIASNSHIHQDLSNLVLKKNIE